MVNIYEVYICDAFGVQLDIIDEWLSLQYVKAVNEVGELSLVLNGDYFINYIKVDGRIGVYRNGKLEFETTWLIRYVERKLDSKGIRTITIIAVSLNELIRRRIVAYEELTPQAVQAGAADDIMKTIGLQNIGTSASAFRDISAYASSDPLVALGPIVAKEFPYDNMFDVFKEISETTITSGSPIYFDVIAPTLSTIKFVTYPKLRGVDHSFPSGVSPVILSPDRGNLANVTRAYDWRDEVTYVYAGGQEAVQTASDSGRIGQSPFNLREAYINVTGTSGSSATIDEAESALRAGRPQKTFRGELINVPGTTEYGVHWDFGDKVTVEFESETFDCTIDTVSVSVVGGKETISAGLRAVDE